MARISKQIKQYGSPSVYVLLIILWLVYLFIALSHSHWIVRVTRISSQLYSSLGQWINPCCSAWRYILRGNNNDVVFACCRCRTAAGI